MITDNFFIKNMLKDWINIFKTGIHTSSRGITKEWTLSELKQLVANFNENDRVPIVVGHPKDNSPAYGWISHLKIEGDKLMAKLADVHDSFKKAVENGLYRNRSISIAKTDDGFKLIHLGWLGGTPPAVEGLEPISHNINAEIDVYEFSIEIDEKTTKNESSKMLINEGTTEQSQSFNYKAELSLHDALAKEVTELRTALLTQETERKETERKETERQKTERQEFAKHIDDLKSENTTLAQQVETERRTRITTEFSYFLDGIENKGVNIPAEKRDLIAFCLSVEGHSFDTPDGKKDGLEFMKDMLGKLTPVVELGTMFPKSEDFSIEKPDEEFQTSVNELTQAINASTQCHIGGKS